MNKRPALLIGILTALSMLILWHPQTLLVQEGRDIRQDYLATQRLLRKIDLYSPFSQVE